MKWGGRDAENTSSRSAADHEAELDALLDVLLPAKHLLHQHVSEPVPATEGVQVRWYGRGARQVRQTLPRQRRSRGRGRGRDTYGRGRHLDERLEADNGLPNEKTF